MIGLKILEKGIPLLIILFILILASVYIAGAIINLKEKKKNDKAPIHSKEAKVVAKRSDVKIYNTSSSSGHNLDGTRSSGLTSTNALTTYFITLEFLDSGERKEFKVADKEYGLLAEEDTGVLKYQGTRYLQFERVIN